MDETRTGRSKTKSFTVAALLGIFVVAVVVALAGRLLPGVRPRLERRLLRGGRKGPGPS
jgi:hypothetical protein